MYSSKLALFWPLGAAGCRLVGMARLAALARLAGLVGLKKKKELVGRPPASAGWPQHPHYHLMYT